MAVFKYLNANGQWESVDTVGAIKYTEQSLSEEQKAQARENIGIEEILNMVNNIGYIDAGIITEEGVDA